MSALEILKNMQRERGSVLWINDERRVAAYQVPREGGCVAVSYSAATIAKTDPRVVVVGDTDGALYTIA